MWSWIIVFLALSIALSTACSSSARAIISGRRLIDAGLADAAIVGGADTLSRMPINGFHSLESLSPTRCQPFSSRFPTTFNASMMAPLAFLFPPSVKKSPPGCA
ncbi:beta-ketoacyl synthase N-terminal-like domain-containing protein [Brevibacterium metallidurans]|uniref:beta-ketoacyl synthase N-terminal-like domain-containing protein n=1 Tax=Brevibacterium metallidurans TaxID=1482676 RepID=UPI003BB73EA9